MISENMNLACDLEITLDDGSKENVGSLYGNIGADLDCISIQMYINSDSKDMAVKNMEQLKIIYDEFYNKFIDKSVLLGWNMFSKK